MTGTTGTARIRWTDTHRGVPRIEGAVGSLDAYLFAIYPPGDGPGRDARWLLCCRLPGSDAFSVYADDPESLKAEAERWLSGFAASLGAAFADEPVTEHAYLMSGGGYHVWNTEPYIEKIYPLEQRIKNGRQNGGHVYRRRVIVVEDWTELAADASQPAAPAAGTETTDGS